MVVIANLHILRRILGELSSLGVVPTVHGALLARADAAAEREAAAAALAA